MVEVADEGEATTRDSPSALAEGRGRPDETVDVGRHGPRGPSNGLVAPMVAGYELVRLLGRGGMGVVWEAIELKFDRKVAIKVHHLDPGDGSQPSGTGGTPDELLREAYLAAKVDDPGIVRVHDVGLTLEGYPYFAMDYVEGTDLSAMIAEGPMAPARAIGLAIDVARAVAAAHDHGVIHRDIKPRNVIVDASGRARVLDFGIALSIQASEKARASFAGSPAYMAPEQVLGKPVGPEVDIHAIGLVLFEMLTGHRAYTGPTVDDILVAVATAPPPSLRDRLPDVHPDVERVVARALAKDPKERWRGARVLLEALHALVEGKPVDGIDHVAMPSYVPKQASTPRPPSLKPRREDAKKTFRWSWSLAASPEALWPWVANTERFNKAIGLSSVAFTDDASLEVEPRVIKTGKMRTLGMNIEWREYPFEWVKNRQHSVFRLYKTGPIAALWNRVTLTPRDGGGTELVHEVAVLQRGILGSVAAFLEIEQKAGKNMARAYRRLDEALAAGLREDPFEGVYLPTSEEAEVVESRVRRLGLECGFREELLAKLRDALLHAPSQTLAQMRPYALADQWGAGRAEVLDLFLHARGVGLVDPVWDVVCPTCRVAHEAMDHLAAVKQKGTCAACATAFERDLAATVELVFKPVPAVRAVARETYCVGAPALRPHIVVQQILEPGEARTVEVDLARGNYRAVAAPATGAGELASSALGWEATAEVVFFPDRVEIKPHTVRAGVVALTLRNETEEEQTVRIEEPGARADAVTAAQALTHPTFKEVCADEILAAGEHLAVSRMAFLFVELAERDLVFKELGDVRAYEQHSALYDMVADAAHREEGVTLGGVLATEIVSCAFPSALRAIRAAVAIVRAAEAKGGVLAVRAGVHEGRCIALSRARDVEYFGQTLHRGAALLKDSPKGGIALSTAVAAERSVMAYLRDQGLASQVVQSSDLAYGGRRVTLAALDAAGLPRARRSSHEMRVVVPGSRPP